LESDREDHDGSSSGLRPDFFSGTDFQNADTEKRCWDIDEQECDEDRLVLKAEEQPPFFAEQVDFVQSIKAIDRFLKFNIMFDGVFFGVLFIAV
jgi:hypothetical protein